MGVSFNNLLKLFLIFSGELIFSKLFLYVFAKFCKVKLLSIVLGILWWIFLPLITRGFVEGYKL